MTEASTVAILTDAGTMFFTAADGILIFAETQGILKQPLETHEPIITLMRLGASMENEQADLDGDEISIVLDVKGTVNERTFNNDRVREKYYDDTIGDEEISPTLGALSELGRVRCERSIPFRGAGFPDAVETVLPFSWTASVMVASGGLAGVAVALKTVAKGVFSWMDKREARSVTITSKRLGISISVKGPRSEEKALAMLEKLEELEKRHFAKEPEKAAKKKK